MITSQTLESVTKALAKDLGGFTLHTFKEAAKPDILAFIFDIRGSVDIYGKRDPIAALVETSTDAFVKAIESSRPFLNFKESALKETEKLNAQIKQLELKVKALERYETHYILEFNMKHKVDQHSPLMVPNSLRSPMADL